MEAPAAELTPETIAQASWRSTGRNLQCLCVMWVLRYLGFWGRPSMVNIKSIDVHRGLYMRQSYKSSRAAFSPVARRATDRPTTRLQISLATLH
jgi:hypothetical protein